MTTTEHRPRRRVCLACERAEQRDYCRRNGEYYREKRAEFRRTRPTYQQDRKHELKGRLNALKESTPCVDCGQHFPSYAMEFDHVRGEKRKTVAQLVHLGYGWATIVAEMAKCELRCVLCHRLRHHG